MSDLRQIPLFPGQPATTDEINRHTTLNATVTLFLQHLNSDGKSQHTVKAFRSDLMLLAEYSDGETPVGQYVTSGLNEFLHWLEHGRGVPCSRKSYARRVTTLKVYFKWLHGIGAIPYDPAKAVLQRSGPAPLSHVLDDAQIKAALDVALGMRRNDEVDYRPAMLYWLLLDTGIKKSEAMRLVPGDIDRLNPERPVLTIRHKVRNVYKERRIALDPEWVRLFDQYLAQYQPEETIFNCTARNLEYILSDVGAGADIPFKLSFEVMRWTSAVRDYLNGVDEEDIRDKLGLSEASWYETGSKVKKLAEQITDRPAV
jgi:integrase/recombinase XerD